MKPTDSGQRDIFELLHRRRKKSSTLFCSQYEFEEWYDQLGGDDSPLADAIIDRIAHDSYRINITSIDAEHDISMREVYGLDKTLRGMNILTSRNRDSGAVETYIPDTETAFDWLNYHS